MEVRVEWKYGNGSACRMEVRQWKYVKHDRSMQWMTLPSHRTSVHPASLHLYEELVYMYD